MPIAQFEGKALVFNNGVVDVQQNGVSVVDENKVAHITTSSEGNVRIDNLTIIKNAEHELEVPFDNDTIYRDSEDGFIKSKEPSDAKIILCTQVGSDPAAPVGSFTLNQASNKTITIPIPEGGGTSEGDVLEIVQPLLDEKQDLLTAGDNIFISSEGVISAVDSKYTAGDCIVISSEGEVSVDYDTYFMQKDWQGKLSVKLGSSSGLALQGGGLGIPADSTLGYKTVGTASKYGVLHDSTLKDVNPGGISLNIKTNGGLSSDNNGVYVTRPMPSYSVADDGKVLTVQQGGGYAGLVWAEAGGGQSYSAGQNISISSEGVISATDTTYTAGNGIKITNGAIGSKVTFTYDSATGELAIVEEA